MIIICKQLQLEVTIINTSIMHTIIHIYIYIYVQTEILSIINKYICLSTETKLMIVNTY